VAGYGAPTQYFAREKPKSLKFASIEAYNHECHKQKVGQIV
jgi:hypothetical protein